MSYLFFFVDVMQRTRPFWYYIDLYFFIREEQQTRINFYINFFYNEHHTEYTSKKEVQSITFFILLGWCFLFFLFLHHTLSCFISNHQFCFESFFLFYYFFILFSCGLKELKKLSFILFYFSLVSLLFLHICI